MANERRCVGCGKSVGNEWITSEGSIWHASCFRCDLCSKPLGSPYTFSDIWVWRVCHRHPSLISCDACGRLHDGARNDPAVLDRCDICRAAGVDSDRAARDRFHASVGWLKKQGLDGDGTSPLKLHLVDASWLHREAGHVVDGQALGVARHTITDYGGGRRTVTHDGIAVLRGLPDPLFESVVIHELGHAWLTIRGVHGLPQRDEEGFCQLLSHRFLSRSPHAAAAGYARKIEISDDPIYGDGFRAVNHLVSQVGFDAIIRSLAGDGRFPDAKQRWWQR